VINDFDIDTDLLLKQIVLMPSDRIKRPPMAIDKNSEAKQSPVSLQEIVKTAEMQPFLLLTTAEIKINMMKPNSNFNKIIASQEITNVTKHIVTDYQIDQTLLAISCIWTIGLPPDEEQRLLRLKHPNALMSANPEELVYKEEKQAMFGPLISFVHSNLKLFSQI
jgi:hypothetical protein